LHPCLSYSVSQKDGNSNQSSNPSLHRSCGSLVAHGNDRLPSGSSSFLTRAREEVPTSKESLSCSNVGTAPRCGAPTQEHGAQGLMPLVILWAGWMLGPRSFLPLSLNREFRPNR
jgi:hypothetical protein